MENERKEMTSAMVVNSKCSNCSDVLRLHLSVLEEVKKLQEEKVKLIGMVQSLTAELEKAKTEMTNANAVKLKEQKEKKQAREKRKKKSLEKQVQKGKTRPKGQTTISGWMQQGAKLDRPKTVAGCEKKRLELLANKASEGPSGRAVSSTQADSETHKLVERVKARVEEEKKQKEESVKKTIEKLEKKELQKGKDRTTTSNLVEEDEVGVEVGEANVEFQHQENVDKALKQAEGAALTMLSSLKVLKKYTTSSAEDKDLQPPTEKIPKVEKQEYFEDNQIKREPMDHAHSAELDNFDQQKCPKQK